jgi:hypothetical protein
LPDKPQKTDLRLGMAPGGWIVVVFGQSEILFGIPPAALTQPLTRHIGPGLFTSPADSDMQPRPPAATCSPTW